MPQILVIQKINFGVIYSKLVQNVFEQICFGELIPDTITLLYRNYYKYFVARNAILSLL